MKHTGQWCHAPRRGHRLRPSCCYCWRCCASRLPLKAEDVSARFDCLAAFVSSLRTLAPVTSVHFRDVLVWVLGLRGPTPASVWQTASLAVRSTFRCHSLFVPKSQTTVQPKRVSHGRHGMGLWYWFPVLQNRSPKP